LTDIAERARTLTRQRRPFVHATVVRAQEPTSARAGDAAVILADGSIEGFVGGQCAESSVRSAALGTLRDGRTLLLRVLPDTSEDFPETPGALVVVNSCHSGGAIEIFLRPVLPAPVVAVAGTTPIGAAVAELAAFLDFEVVSPPGPGPGPGSGSGPGSEAGPGSEPGSESGPGAFQGATAAVVASLGKGEEEAIRAALDAGVGFIALVASRKRGGAMLAELALSEAERARIHTPAGVDIGARTPQEIALSIMSEVVRAIRVDGLTAAAGPAAPPRTATDPVCGMTVVVAPGAIEAAGHFFCGTGCRDTFLARD
jgi:xanthine dehydrogenase accessory factor